MHESRSDQRLALAQALKHMTYAELFEFGITRVANVGGMDTVGIPFFTSMRPGGVTISINGGKSLDADMSRAGAILEAMEIHVGEHPNTPFVAASANELHQAKIDHMRPELWSPAIGSIVNEKTIIPWETMDVIGDVGFEKFVPSDLIWMVPRNKKDFCHWQMTSNGLASGFSRMDAEVSALYEVIERDAWTCFEVLNEATGIWPCRIDLGGAGGEIQEIIARISAQNLVAFVLDITTDIRIPVFTAVICDLNPNPGGMFAGYGCSLDAQTAIKRALLEAAQSRCLYIAGARDDLFRRSFLLLKQVNQHVMAKHYGSLRKGLPITAYEPRVFATVEEELKSLLIWLFDFTAEVYSKELWKGAIGQAEASIVRVVAPELETAHFEHYQPGKRVKKYIQKCSQNLKK